MSKGADILIKIIFDCDNTMGLKGKDVDDGLTLLYLLGNKQINLLGVTTTFGNSNINDVYNNTISNFNEIGCKNLPLFKGSGVGENRVSPASKFLVDMVNEYPGEITILGTGSLTNLYGANLIDKDFYSKVKKIVLMGGITKPLVIEGKVLNELNFSSDYEAAYNVLSSGAKVTIITGHICLQAIFSKNEYDYLMNNKNIPCYRYIKKKSYLWYEYFKELFKTEGFFNWDIVAAMYITNADLFDENIVNIISNEDDLKTGFLKISDENPGYKINIPTKIKDIRIFNDIIFDSWKNVNIATL